MLKGFREFIFRGNVLDLAVGVVIGAAFGAVVTALVKDLITPLIGAIIKAPDFSQLTFTIHGSQFMYGDFLNALISFILIASSVYFFIILPLNTVISKMKKQKTVDPTTKKCPECMAEIPLVARRCMHCTQVVS